VKNTALAELAETGVVRADAVALRSSRRSKKSPQQEIVDVFMCGL
jgi:hypothetical protein